MLKGAKHSQAFLLGERLVSAQAQLGAMGAAERV